jgi:hypothetical protein
MGGFIMAIIQLASDTLAGSASVGQIEYNGTIQTFTPLGTQRGVVPNEQFFRLNAGVAGADSTTVQSLFGVGVTLSASTQYEFEIMFALSKPAGTTSHTISLLFGGTATLNNIGYFISNSYGNSVVFNAPNESNAASTASNTSFSTVATAVVITKAVVIAATAYGLLIKGTVSINAGGTFIPQYTLSAAPGGAYTTQIGSYIKIKPIGVSGANVSVGAWS